MKIAVWKLKAGDKKGQESLDKKKRLGEEYVALLKETRNVTDVQYYDDEIRIIMEDDTINTTTTE